MQDSSSDNRRKSRDTSSDSHDERRPRSRNRRRPGNRPQGDKTSAGSSRDSSAQSSPRGRSSSKSDANAQGASSSGRTRKSSTKPAAKETFLQAVVRVITFGRVNPASKNASTGKPVDRPSVKTRDSKEGLKRRDEETKLRIEPSSPRLYVGNLAYSVKSEDLEVLFSSYGNVVEARVITRSGTDQSKGFGFVEMSTISEARAAAAALYDHEFRDRKLLVTGAKEDGRSESDSEPVTHESRPRSTTGTRESSSRGRGEKREREGGASRRERGPRSRGSDSQGSDKDSRKVRPRPIPIVSSPNLELSNLNAHAGEVEISVLFEGIGILKSRSESGSGEGGNTRNYQIEMGSVEEAQKAVTLLDGKHFMGYRLSVTGESAE